MRTWSPWQEAALQSLLFKEVDVKYSDGMLYRVKITAYDEETDHYTVVFDNDGEDDDFQ